MRPGSEADARLTAELDRVATPGGPGQPADAVNMPGNVASKVGLVRWNPRSA